MHIVQADRGETPVSLQDQDRGSRFWIWVLVLVINGVVLVNGILHHPQIQYDGSGHMAYVQAFSQLRLVTPEDSREFFSAPLAYVVPSLLMAATGMDVRWAMKAAQLVNVALSVGLTLLLLRICGIMSPRSSLKIGVLLLLGSLPAYYRTFAYVRGEPFVLFWAVLLIYIGIQLYVLKRYTLWNALWLGGAMGMAALSRQWGIFLFPAIVLFAGWQWLRYREERWAVIRSLTVALVITGVVSGWYYTSLWDRYGSITAFNQEAAPGFGLNNQPSEFYWGRGGAELFSNPLRPYFANQLWPILYADLWGDYWSYFLVYGIDRNQNRFISGKSIYQSLVEGEAPEGFETNYNTIGPYLGRVNRVSLLPTALFLIGIGFGTVGLLIRSFFGQRRRAIHTLLLLAVASSLAGYFWFLLMYPSLGKGDTIKATYIFQVAPLLALVAGSLFDYLGQRWPKMYTVGVIGLVLVFLHNLPAMVTHYPIYRIF